MRGTASTVSTGFLGSRITPAHAGNSRNDGRRDRRRGDHPRTCGEQSNVLISNNCVKGSPPHMRGTAVMCACIISKHRITPAHAGNSRLRLGSPSSGKDHPRTCGEQCFTRAAVPCARGSPPHMRGTVPPCSVQTGPPGITPAHAGNSDRHRHRCCILKDHPRTCGEQKEILCPSTCTAGSPPHMRGTVQDIVSNGNAVRITPAHAGNSV